MITPPPPQSSVLTDLAATLAQQATSAGSLTLSADVIPAADVASLDAALQLAGAPFVVAAVKASDISPPAASASSLRISPSQGTVELLNGQSFNVDLLFTLDDTGALVTTIGLAPASGWKLTDSFPNITSYPFDSTTVSLVAPRFIYASQARTAHTPWLDKLTDTIDLAAGLNFAAWTAFTLTGPAYSVLGTVLQSGTSLKFFGPFALVTGDNCYPVTSLAGQLAVTGFTIVGDLDIDSLGLTLQITDAVDGVQDLQLLLSASRDNLVFTVIVDPLAPGITFTAAPKPNTTVDATYIGTLPGGEFFQPTSLPSGLSDAFKSVDLESFAIVLSAPGTVSYVGLTIATPDGTSWELIKNALVLKGLALQLDVFEPGGDATRVAASVRATCKIPVDAFPGTFDFNVALDSGDKGEPWQVTNVGGSYAGSMKLGDLVSGIVGGSVPVPDALNDVVFSDFGVVASKVSDTFGYQITGKCDTTVPMLGTTLIAALTVNATWVGTEYTVDLGGAIDVGEQDFHIDLALGRDGDGTKSGTLSAQWTATDTDYLEFGDIATAFGFSKDDIPAIPDGLDLALSGATLTYDFEQAQLGIGLTSAHYGNAVFAAVKNPDDATKWQYFFGLAAPTINLATLPLIESFAGDAKVEIDELQVILASRAIADPVATTINALIGTLAAGPYPQVPDVDKKGMAAGAGFSMKIVLPGFSHSLVVGASGKPASDAKTNGNGANGNGTGNGSGNGTAMRVYDAAPPAPPAPPPAAPTSASATWIQVGKTLGPVSIARVGVQYQAGRLFFLLDASLGFSALTLGLDGLGVGSPLTSFSPEPHLSGISLSFDSGPVTIDGALLVVPPDPKHPEVTEEYIGTVVVKVDPYTIGGVASYAKVSGAPSVMVFAQLQGEIGGSPAFFITGFMGGFGYNSRLTLPSADQVRTFPFVAGLDNPKIFGSTSPSPLKVLNVLSGADGSSAWVTPTVGEQWVAAGVMFRSFELVIGHALVVATFGREFEVALLGTASMSLPQGATDDAYAYVELQLEALFKPDEGSFSIIASVTDNSYLLTSDCHLTGGFAFCLWFGDNLHAGDFVVTIGGYHPAFVVPAWYPQAAPVGFNWTVSGNVTVKGGAYFALTPTAAMAGGSLEALFHSGDLKAWFTAWANMMIRWKPFYFVAGIGISIGASYRLNLLFTSVTVSIELGATLDLWGPPTGGVVHVHWTIISFSVSFGSGQMDQSAMTLDWPGFKTLLPNKPAPPAPESVRIAAVAAVGDDENGDESDTSVLLTASINGGLVRKESDGSWTVRADELVFTTESAFPATSVTVDTTSFPPTSTKTINVRPMKKSNLHSVHTVRLWNDTESVYEKLAAWPNATIQSRNLPDALWGAPLDDTANPSPAAATIRCVTGVQLTAPPATSGKNVGDFNPLDLIDELGGGYMPLDPTSQQDTIPAPVADASTVGSMMTTAASPASWSAQVQAQSGLATALGTLGAAPPSSAPLKNLATQAGNYFTQAPLRAVRAS